jgi:hypothetical protein
LIRETLAEFGKGDYNIIFSEGLLDGSSMTIDDVNGIVYVSITGLGFGNAEQMRKNAQHEGAHGTDFNVDIDERLASEIGKVEKYERPRIKYPDGGSREVQLGTLLYLNALLNDEDLRNKTIIGLAYQNSDLRDIEGISLEDIKNTIEKESGKNANGLHIDEYGNDQYAHFIGIINYYYWQSKNMVTDISELSSKDYVEINPAESVFHNIIKDGDTFYINVNTDTMNKKYVNYENGREVITNSDGTEIITDPTNRGTFNYYTYDLNESNKNKGIVDSTIIPFIDTGFHGIDIMTWVSYGTGYDDNTSLGERVEILLLGRRISAALSSKNQTESKIFTDFTAQYDHRVTKEVTDEYDKFLNQRNVTNSYSLY